MKKAKVILTAMAVLTVVGGALAFKAQKMNGNLFCTTSLGQACTRDGNQDLITYAITATTSSGISAYCTATSAGDKCKDVTTTTFVTVNE